MTYLEEYKYHCHNAGIEIDRYVVRMLVDMEAEINALKNKPAEELVEIFKTEEAINAHVKEMKDQFEKEPENPLDVQIGGGHYKDMAIQPVEFAMKNNLNTCQANVVKYVCRYNTKNGLEDLKKAKHYIDLIIEIEEL